MADRLERALRAGRAPSAPGFVGWWAAVGGLLGTLLAAAFADWSSLAECWSGTCTPSASLAGVPLVGALGALLAGAVGRRLAGPARWGLRLGWHPLTAPRSTGVAATVCAVAAAALTIPVLPGLVPEGDPGWALVLMFMLSAVVVGAAVGLPATVERVRALAAWRRLVDPQPLPRHDEDDLPPAVRAALRARPPPLAEVLAQVCLVITHGDYAVALLAEPDRAPRVAAHGGPELIGDRPAVEHPQLAEMLASTPTGEPAPPAAWPALKALLSECPSPPSGP